jgi:type IV secretion system protein VirB10
MDKAAGEISAPGSARDQVVADRSAARQSGLFAALPPRPAPASSAPGSRPDAARLEQDSRMTSPERLRPPASAYVLQAGAIIPAVLVTGLRSDLAGVAVAQVGQDVFDSLGGGHRLIPAGARLIGSYEASPADGQGRLAVAWTRLILPNGRSIMLEDLTGADPQGMAGLKDGVDRHGGRIAAAAALSTILAIGAQAGAGGGDDEIVRAIRQGASQAVTDVGRQAVGKSLALAPTVTIRPGAPLRVLLTKDLVLEPYVERSGP